MVTATRQLILCADDFAVHAAASQGIARLAAMGRISATSAMVLSPRWADDAKLLHAVRGQVDVGLHLDWTSEFAIAAGHGLSLGAAMAKALWGGFRSKSARKAVRGVIDRQLDAFEVIWKAPPDHVDGHQHVQQFAGIREELVAALANRYGRGAPNSTFGQAAPYLRISRAPRGAADFKSRIIASMGANALEIIAEKEYLTRANGLLGIYNFAIDGPAFGQRMKQWMAQAPAGSVIMCHPAMAADSPDGKALFAERSDPIRAARRNEFAYLSSDAFPLALAEAGVELTRGA